MLGTRSDEDIRKTIILHIDGEDHTIHIDEIDSLHYPTADSICYSMDTFHSNLVLEDRYTTCGSQSSSNGTITNIPVETTHDVGLDMGEKMNFISNCDEAPTAKPHLAGDPAHREAIYSAPTRLQDHISLVIINALQQLGGQVHFPTISTDLFPKISRYTQNLNHRLMLEAQLSLVTYCSDSFNNISCFSCSNYDLAISQFKIHGPKRMKQANP